MNRFEVERFEKICSEINDYIYVACSTFSVHFRHIEIDDLKQECYLKVIHIMHQYKARRTSELVSLSKSSIYNMLRDMYRANKTRRTYDLVQINDDGEEATYDVPDTETDILAEVMLKDVLKKLEETSDPRVFQLLALIVNPDEGLVKSARKNAKKRGTEVTILAKDLAKRMRVSSATLSRLMSSLRGIVLDAVRH